MEQGAKRLGGWQQAQGLSFRPPGRSGGRMTALSMRRFEHPVSRGRQCRLTLKWIGIRYDTGPVIGRHSGPSLRIASRYEYAALFVAGCRHKWSCGRRSGIRGGAFGEWIEQAR
jgi:hypothetical protein